MRRQLFSSVIAIGLSPLFSGVVTAQEQRCASVDILKYDLKSDGMSLQSSGTIHGGERDGHIFEFYANDISGEWTFMEIQAPDVESMLSTPSETQACFFAQGGIYAHLKGNDNDGQMTTRQSITALHGGGDDANGAYEIYAHQGSGRWFLSYRISADKSQILMAGSDFEEFNRAPISPRVRASYTLDHDGAEEAPRLAPENF